MTAASELHVSIAILYQQGQFLMQLRDNIPSILYPGHWGFFGGHLEPGESPEVGLWRELEEEIAYQPPLLHWWRNYDSDRNNTHVKRFVFHAPLTVSLNQLILQEGWDLSLISPQVIEQGVAFSAKAGRQCPIGPNHQKILLDFMQQETCWRY